MQVVLWHRIVVVLISQNLEARRAAMGKVIVAEALVPCLTARDDVVLRRHKVFVYSTFKTLYMSVYSSDGLYICI